MTSSIGRELSRTVAIACRLCGYAGDVRMVPVDDVPAAWRSNGRHGIEYAGPCPDCDTEHAVTFDA